MKQELDALLCERYPKIFVNRHAPMNETAMCWGFEHGDGWFNIINALCGGIQNHIDWKNSKEELVPQVVATQVKEKFGALRFYYEGGDETVSGMVRMAESMSAITCEICGNPGSNRSVRGWLTTLCDVHYNERLEKMKELNRGS